jgi:hypothetical protein
MARLRKLQIARWHSGRRVSTPVTIAAIAVLAVTAFGLTGGFTGARASGASAAKLTLNRQQFAQMILKTQAASIMTGPAQAVLRMQATGTKDLSPGIPPNGTPAQQSGPAGVGGSPMRPSFTNVRVSNPAQDTNEPDQTTQSEPMIAVSGSHVAVGYNDSQQTGLALTAGSDLAGYSYSGNGGASFTDGGTIPNTPEFVNLSDPWLVSTRAGDMYYSDLSYDLLNINLDVTVAGSANGGKTWGTPVPVYRPPLSIFYTGDKPALAAGPDPVVKARDDLYTTWDDFSFDSTTGQFFAGLPVAHSTDGGATWSLVYADRINLTNVTGCSSEQYIGATPIANPADGTLYVVAEKLVTNDPNCVGTPPVRSEWIFRSTDGGKTFGPGVQIATATAAVPNGALFLGPGKYMRNLELPAIALRGNTIYIAWNDGAQGPSHIRLATSTDNGQTWSVSFVTSGLTDDVQPALSADSSGIHLLYYHRNPDDTLDVLVGNSANGTAFTTRRVTTQSFPGVLTVPQFDPITAFTYMGDYIANVSDGTHQYFAWGDNRDTVADFLYPNGRNDPDVFFAKQ